MDEQSNLERTKYEAMWARTDYREFSPGMEALTQLHVVEIFKKAGATSILDAGCGSGQAMEWLVRHHGHEFRVHGFDIAANCLNEFFKGREAEFLSLGSLWAPEGLPQGFDAVFCTDVMEHIPPERVDAVLENLCRATGKIAFMAIALFDDAFGPAVMNAPLHLSVFPESWWLERMAAAGFQVDWYGTTQNENGEPGYLYLVMRPKAAV